MADRNNVLPGPYLQAVSDRSQVSIHHEDIRPNTYVLPRRSIADVFRIQVISNSDVRAPIITLGSTSFFHVRANNLYVVAVTK